jgi:20S proteasome alpha/beta subunit
MFQQKFPEIRRIQRGIAGADTGSIPDMKQGVSIARQIISNHSAYLAKESAPTGLRAVL